MDLLFHDPDVRRHNGLVVDVRALSSCRVLTNYHGGTGRRPAPAGDLLVDV